MHPLVRDLYKRALIVGRDYPTGLANVREAWKKALRDHRNCPSCYRRHIPTGRSDASTFEGEADDLAAKCHEELLEAVHRGRQMIKEMVGVIQIKKYRSMKQRYGSNESELESEVDSALKRLEAEDVQNPHDPHASGTNDNQKSLDTNTISRSEK